MTIYSVRGFRGTNLNAAAQERGARTNVSLLSVPQMEWKQQAQGVWMGTVWSAKMGLTAFAGSSWLDGVEQLGSGTFPREATEVCNTRWLGNSVGPSQ